MLFGLEPTKKSDSNPSHLSPPIYSSRVICASDSGSRSEGMAIYCGSVLPKSLLISSPLPQWRSRSSDGSCSSRAGIRTTHFHFVLTSPTSSNWKLRVNCSSGDGDDGSGSGSKKGSGSVSGSVPNSNYVVPLDKSAYYNSSCITRPLAEILRDLNKRIPDNIINDLHDKQSSSSTFISWYHANRMLSFYAPGWCGEIRDVIFSDNGGVTVVYRVTIRGSDGEAHRESTGTVSSADGIDPVATAEEIAFCRACARFGLGLYLYHEE